MNRPTTALLAALDALLAVAIGLGIPVVMLTILWAVQFDLSIDWIVFWRAGADFWMLGNGVDLLVGLDPQTAANLGFDQLSVPFEIGFAPLGFTLLTIALGRRSGLRLGFSPHPLVGLVVGVATVAALTGLVWATSTATAAATVQGTATSTSGSAVVTASLQQAIVFLPALYALGVVIGGATTLSRLSTPLTAGFDDLVDRLSVADQASVGVALRGGAMIAAAMIAVGGLAVALLLAIHYATVISLYESLQSAVAGGAALTIAQLALLPNLAVWAASWFLGPGFALGTGSSVAPLATQLGPIPSLPVFGALPVGAPLGFIALVVPVAIGFAAAVVLRPRLVAASGSSPVQPLRMLGTGFGMGIVAASILSLGAIVSGGALGPGRLADVGADPGAVWVWAAVEFSVACTLGLFASGARRALLPGDGSHSDGAHSDGSHSAGAEQTTAAATAEPRPMPLTSTSASGAAQAAGKPKPAAGNARPAAGYAQPAAGNAQPAAGNARPVSGEARPVSGDAQSAVGNARPPIGKARPASATALPAPGEEKQAPEETGRVQH